MGVYAQTDFTIECKTEKSAKMVIELLKKTKEDKNGNTFGRDLTQEKCFVYGQEDSGRIQNLEYRIGKIWEKIKSIPGVIELNAPFMAEADGMCFSNERPE